MKRPILGSALVLALLMSLGPAAQPAEAGRWYLGAGFKVGGVHFSLAFDRHARYHRPTHYYRTSHRLRYDGYRCGSACFKKSRDYYHHSSCGLVSHHFRRHHYDPRPVVHYGERGYYGHRGYGYREYGHKDYGYPGRGHRDYGRRGSYYDSHRSHDPRYCPYR